jgi:hypothetical protein
VFAAYRELASVGGVAPPKIWTRGLAVVEQLNQTRTNSLDSGIFPNDGTNFHKTQVRTFCDIFGLSDPASVLQEVWDRLDTVVADRNSVAHGKETPDEVGRRYTLPEINELVRLWDERWTEFINWVEAAAATRDFYRLPR